MFGECFVRKSGRGLEPNFGAAPSNPMSAHPVSQNVNKGDWVVWPISINEQDTQTK